MYPGSSQMVGESVVVEQKLARRILVIDDQPSIISAVKDILVNEQFQVETALDTQEARERLQLAKPDLIICDIMMPHEDGYAFYQSLRQDSKFADIPFIFLTAVSDSNQVRAANELGIDDYVFKPFEPQDLVSIVKGRLKRAGEHSNLLDAKMEGFCKRVIHTLSHEFRTPLVAVNTGTELLHDQFEKLDRQVLFELIESIQRGGQRLQHLVEDFITVQQIDSGHAEVIAKRYRLPIGLDLLAQRALASFEDEVSADEFKRIKYHQAAGRGNLEVCVCEIQITEVIHRLLSNALKFSSRNDVVELTLPDVEGAASLIIRDYGQGIPDSVAKEACGMFNQINRETIEQQGCGLGLAIVCSFLAINNGMIAFHTTTGRGTEVEIRFPLVNR